MADRTLLIPGTQASNLFDANGVQVWNAVRVGVGLTRDELVEVLMQTAVYAGVPAANAALKVAAEVLGSD